MGEQCAGRWKRALGDEYDPCKNWVLARRARDGRYYCKMHHPDPDVQAKVRGESAVVIASYARDMREGRL